MSSENTKIKEVIQEYAPEKGNLMAVLRKVQQECGNHLPPEVMKEIAIATGIPLNRLYGFVSFYTMLSPVPRGRHIIRVCKDGPCNFKDGWVITDLLEKELGIEVGETTEDGRFTLEETACIGACTEAPAIMVDDVTYANVTPERLGEILKKYR